MVTSSRFNQNPLDQAQADAFTRDARASLLSLRQATAQVLTEVGGLDRPVRLAERLSIDRSLAWKIWQVGQGGDDCPSTAHVPGAAGFNRFLSAAKRAGVPASTLARARESYEAVGAVVRTHASDGGSGRIMLSALSGEGRRRLEKSLRRDCFRAQSHFLGVQARTLYQCDVLMPSVPGCLPDVARVRAHFGLNRTRANVSWVLSRSTLVSDSGPVAAYRRDPLGPIDAADDRAPWLIEPFCSSPLPMVHRRVLGGVTIEDELQPGPVGQTAAVDVTTGELVTRMPDHGAAQDAVAVAVGTPCEHLVHEVMVAERCVRGPLTLRLHSTIAGELPYLRSPESCMIPAPENYAELGRADELAPLTTVPRHAELLNWVWARLGLNPGVVQAWRLCIDMPPVPCCAAATYLLPRG